MKHFLLLFLTVCTLGSLSAQSTIFVKQDATGANNGSSWADAYTTLYAALNAATSGDQIWVAAGTYKPDAGNPNSSFEVPAGVALYGGFNGSESTLSARNYMANLTTLSGDLAGNDIVGNFGTNRADNSTHVIVLIPSAQPSDRAVVDGFTISGGNTLVGAGNPVLSRYGGGILVGAKATVRNCHFTDNNGEYGGALAALDDVASGLLVDNCLFDKNATSLLSSGIYMIALLNGGAITKCTFKDNTTIRGCLYMTASSGILIDSCLFENNTAGTNPCAGLYSLQTSFTLTNSNFINNSGVDYGAIYNDGRDNIYPFVINNCRFEGNVATDTDANPSAVGGAVFNFQPAGEIKNCTFKNNTADRGAALYNSGTGLNKLLVIDSCVLESNAAVGTSSRGGGMYNDATNIEIKNSQFKNNSTATSAGSGVHNATGTTYYISGCEFTGGTAAFGGGAGNYNAGTIGTYENCLFKGNNAATSGGAITNGFEAETTLKNCTLESNNARFGAGLFAQNANTIVTMDSCIIVANTATTTGGGVNMSGGNILNMDNCYLEGNMADVGGGVAISDDTLDNGNAVIRNTVFLSNFCSSQAAGLNVSNTDVLLENVLFVFNQNNGTGAGGAISNNASGTTNGQPSTSPIKAVNCTIADNVAVIGAGIAQWTDNIAQATLELQNCILANNLLNNYEIEDGLPLVTSLGGNLSTDLSLSLVLTQTNDLLELDPMFEDASSFDYHLKAGSPCIDNGIATGAPATDLEGNPRIGEPDQGCYEYQSVSTKQPRVQTLPLYLQPNPAVDFTVLVIDNEWSGEAEMQVVAQNGAIARTQYVQKPAGRWNYPVDLRDLPAGMYTIQVRLGQVLYTGNLVRK